jgi:hypothetical protein
MEDASMTKTERVRLIAVLIFFSAISLSGSSYAQQTVSGEWFGVESFTSVVYINDQIVGESSGINVPAYLAVDFYGTYYGARMIFSIGDFSGDDFGFVGYAMPLTFGPQGAEGSANIYGGNGSAEANFDLTYQAILSDGSIDTSGGFAVADIDDVSFNSDLSTYTVSFASFESVSVPEPSSLVLAASGILMVSIFASIRGFTGR